MQEAIQYAVYTLPSRAPPSRLFGPVWSILYILIFISYWFVFAQIVQKKLHRTFANPFIINIIANASFTYIQFNLENYRLAVADILIVLWTIIRTMQLLRPRIKRAFRLQLPYLLRVSFATILAIRIAIHN
jgi:tryptophan-rich sensory protein